MLSEEVTLEAQQDLEILRSLFKKYHVCFAGNLEETIEKAAGITKEETKTFVKLDDGIYTREVEVNI